MIARERKSVSICGHLRPSRDTGHVLTGHGSRRRALVISTREQILPSRLRFETLDENASRLGDVRRARKEAVKESVQVRIAPIQSYILVRIAPIQSYISPIVVLLINPQLAQRIKLWMHPTHLCGLMPGGSDFWFFSAS